MSFNTTNPNTYSWTLLLLLIVISVYDVSFWLYCCCFAIVYCSRC